MPSLIHKKTKQTLAQHILLAHNFFTRIRGLLGYKEIKPHQAMWIKPCSCIHTFFMKFPIDVIFTDKNFCIKSICKNISPWKLVNSSGKILSPFQWLIHPSTYNLKNYFQVRNVFEFQGGLLSQYSLNKGDVLHVEP